LDFATDSYLKKKVKFDYFPDVLMTLFSQCLNFLQQFVDITVVGNTSEIMD